jgi:Tektin family
LYQELLDTKMKLEEEIKVKVNSLRIDQQRCMATRRTFPYNIISTRYY